MSIQAQALQEHKDKLRQHKQPWWHRHAEANAAARPVAQLFFADLPERAWPRKG